MVIKRIEPEVRTRLDNLPEFLEKYQEVIPAYLFGSYAKGEVGPLSDIHIAYLFAQQTCKDSLDKDLELQSKLTMALGTDEVDCYLLNKAALPFQCQVISTGKLIYCRDQPTKEQYERQVILEYERKRRSLRSPNRNS